MSPKGLTLAVLITWAVLCGVPCLTSFADPSHGNLSPADFVIPAQEKTMTVSWIVQSVVGSQRPDLLILRGGSPPRKKNPRSFAGKQQQSTTGRDEREKKKTGVGRRRDYDPGERMDRIKMAKHR
eukprot:2998799-Rhodomonas_salina.3